MGKIVPGARPKAPESKVRAILKAAGVTDRVAVLAVRGYYRDTMGAPGKNDRGIYDDAVFVVTPNAYAAFNANTDPSRHRKGIASLVAGLWRYLPGKHPLSRPGGYPAFRQAAPVTVLRDGGAKETGWFGINIHRGGRMTTSSEGCQTIHPDQWDAFRALLYSELKRAGQSDFPYLLIENGGQF